MELVIFRTEQSDRPYGAVFLASPDLSRRDWRAADRSTPRTAKPSMAGPERGYTDYPFLAKPDIA